MSTIESSAVETTTSVVPPAPRWWRVLPILGIGLAVLIAAWMPPRRPTLPEDTSILRPAALDTASADELRNGLWCIEEMQLGQKTEFSRQRQTNRSIPGHLWRWTACVSRDTLEITSVNLLNNGGPGDQTAMVFVVRYDPEGMGTLNALPIRWNDEKEDVLRRIDADESLKGLYDFNGGRMRIWIPGDASASRPTNIPATLSHADRLFELRRYPDREVSATPVLLPSRMPMDFKGTIHKINSDGTVEFTTLDGYDGIMRVEDLPQPITTPIEPYSHPPRSDRIFIFRHTNGWIVQTESPENPQPRRPSKTVTPPVNPALKWIREQAKKLK